MRTPFLPIERILESCSRVEPDFELGRSREGRVIGGFALGSGPLRVSLIGGCHADEPVGPATLSKLVEFLRSLSDSDPLLTRATWRIVPHVNPDGRLRNASWVRSTQKVEDHRGLADIGYRLGDYLQHVVRELPGDDIEFGFPRHADDFDARPENRAVADFLVAGAPYHLHGTFHGMGFAPGPWFLIEASWIDRTRALRDSLRQSVRDMGYALFDPDRKGEKGFHRIDPGFCTRPDSVAMKGFFESRHDLETATKFRPSSMEYVRSLGGDPLTFVSEMPLFLTPPQLDGKPVEIAEIQLLRSRLQEHLASVGTVEVAASKLGVEPMPIRDQQRLQLRFLEESLQTAAAQREGS